jgi:hypothetical protein
LPVGDVLPGAVIPVFLGQTEVDKKELVAVASDPHQEVIRLDIPAKKRGSNFADLVPAKSIYNCHRLWYFAPDLLPNQGISTALADNGTIAS